MKKILIICLIALTAVSIAAQTPAGMSEIDKFHTTWRLSFIQPTIFVNDNEVGSADKAGFLMGLDFQVPILKSLIHDYDGLGIEIGLHAAASVYTEDEVGLASIRIPVIFKYHVFKKGDYGVNVQFGPAIEYCLLTLEDSPTGANTVVMNFAVGVGFNIGSTLIDFRYEWGLGSYLKAPFDRKLRRIYFGISF